MGRLGRYVPTGLAALALACTVAGQESDGSGSRPASRSPTLAIESWAPGVFDGGVCPQSGSATYQVDATVLLPLLFTAMPLTSRSDVGAASFNVYDCAQPGETPLRAYEFFAGSFPERARGLNRLGFLREVVRLSPTGPEATAHVGVITANDEESLDDAKNAVDSETAGQRYSLISGVIGRTEASNAVTHTVLAGRWTSAAELYRTARPIWLREEPTYLRHVVNDRQQSYGVPLGFLGALQMSLREVATSTSRPQGVVKPVTAYVHNGRVYHLHVTDAELDGGRSREYAEDGLVRPGARVWRVEYRIVNDRRKEVETFRIWTELPARDGGTAFTGPPIVPVAFDFRPRSFLELRAIRVAPPR